MRLPPAKQISESDRRQLAHFEPYLRSLAADFAEDFLLELERAKILKRPTERFVALGSTVQYEMDGSLRVIQLVLPEEADVSANKISVFTPIGAALIGRAEGELVAWQSRDGRTLQLTIKRLHPPAAAPAESAPQTERAT